MKKSIKRLLVLTQVLGLSALAATACTKNTAETKPTDNTTSKSTNANKETESGTKNTTDNKNTEESKNPTTVTLAEPNQLNNVDQEKVRAELKKDLFKDANLEKIAKGESISDNNMVKGLIDHFPITIENDKGTTTMPDETISNFLKKYEDGIIKGDMPSDTNIAQASEIDQNKKSIDGENKKLDPNQAKAPQATNKTVKTPKK